MESDCIPSLLAVPRMADRRRALWCSTRRETFTVRQCMAVPGGVGTVYELSHGKKGWKEHILYSFKGGKKDGTGPFGGMVLDAGGNLYGTTDGGGKYGKYCNGTVFELAAPVGKVGYKEKVLWNFDGPDGSEPDGILLLDRAGNLKGTTYAGGTSNWGGVFELTP